MVVSEPNGLTLHTIRGFCGLTVSKPSVIMSVAELAFYGHP